MNPNEADVLAVPDAPVGEPGIIQPRDGPCDRLRSGVDIRRQTEGSSDLVNERPDSFGVPWLLGWKIVAPLSFKKSMAERQVR
jgi:hypothetical protein